MVGGGVAVGVVGGVVVVGGVRVVVRGLFSG